MKLVISKWGVQKIQGRKYIFFLVCKESVIFFKITVEARTSGEMAKLRGAKNEGVSCD